MKPRVSVLTLGVDDMERALRFYREGLGLKSEGIVGTEFEHGAVVFFPLQGNLMLALYSRNRPHRRSGEATRATSRTRTDTYGKSLGTPNSGSKTARKSALSTRIDSSLSDGKRTEGWCRKY